MSEAKEFSGVVNDRAKLELDDVTLARWRARLRTLANSAVTLTIEKESASLSARQRRWYFGPILKPICAKTGHTKDEMHAYFKGRLLGNPESRLIVLVDANGEIRDEREVLVDLSITKLNTRSMATYLDDIRDIAADELGIVIPDPDPRRRTAEAA